MIIVQTTIARWNESPGPEVLPLPDELLQAEGPLVVHRIEFCEGQYNDPFVTIKSGKLDILPPYRFGESSHGMLVFYGKKNPWWPDLSDSLPFLTLRRGQIARLEHTRPGAWDQMRHWRQIDHIVCTEKPRPRLFLDRPPTITKVAIQS